MSSKSKIHEKRRPKFGPNEPKLGPKLGFLPFSQVQFISFPGNRMQSTEKI